MIIKLSEDSQLEIDDNGNLPPGIHETTIEYIELYYSFSPKRKELILGLKEMLKDLKDIGCKYFYLDGSFVTNKLEPGDFDACWKKNNGIDWRRIRSIYPELILFDPPRAEQKDKYLGEAFISDTPIMQEDGSLISAVEFFQLSRDGSPKGILLIRP